MPSSEPFPHSFGWLPDLPDSRDYTRSHPKIAPLLAKTASKPASAPPKPPSSVDLRPFCPPVFDQGDMGSCTANAAAGLLAFHNKRSFFVEQQRRSTSGAFRAGEMAIGKDSALSRLFIYKSTRDLMMAKGDSGAYIRTTMGSLALFGAPPEKYWAYSGANLDEAPPAFCYSYASNYQALSYFRLDEKAAPNGKGTPNEKDAKLPATSNPNPLSNPASPAPPKNRADTLLEIKGTLSSSLPVMFGFQVFESIKGASGGRIPYPTRGESVLGGHAVLAVGYDDNLTIGDCTGAFLIRNSWGEAWGEKGYGWLPYEYLLGGLAEDWWCLVKAEWMETGEFGV